MKGDAAVDFSKVLAVVGPTASGKTWLAVQLAKRYGGEVISCDSMQIYRYMTIGTAKPTAREMEGIPHHLVDFLDPDQPFSVAEYVELARKKAAEISQRGHLPILAGGTGLYLDAFLTNTSFAQIQRDDGLRQELEQLGKDRGPDYLHSLLAQVDPELAQKLHPHNVGRVIRALEVYRLTGIPMSQHQAQSRLQPPSFQSCVIGLDCQDRSHLYERINLRVDQMMEQGLLEEVRALRERGFSRTACQAIGYKELFGFLEGNMTLPEAVELVKRSTRRYAKRQLTWFRRNPDIHWINIDIPGRNSEDILKDALQAVEMSGLI